MNLVEEMCDRLFMIQNGQKVIYGTLDEVKTKYANFKCTIRGKNARQDLERIPSVQRVEEKDETTILYLDSDVEPTSWLKNLPSDLTVHELKINRISLHEIFIDIATNRKLIQEAGDLDA